MAENGEKTAAELFGEGAEPRDTRERLLFTALNLFYAHGFHAVGLDRILADVGVTKTTFYNHFESRDQLVLEAVKLRDAWEAASFANRLKEVAGYKPRAMLLGVFDVLDEWFNDPEYRGCIFLTAAAEFPSLHHPVHRVADGHYGLTERTLRDVAAAADAPDPDALAREWVVLVEGAVTYRLITGDNGSARTARSIAARILDEALGPVTGG